MLCTNEDRRLSCRIFLRPTVVFGRKHIPHCFLLHYFCESRRPPNVESEYGGGFFGRDRDVGDIVRVDSRYFFDKREGISVWDCFRVVKNVRFPPIAFQTDWSGLTLGFVSRGGMIAPILGGQLLTIDVSFPVYTSVVTFIIAGICVLFLKEAEKQEEGENQRAALH